MKITPNRIVSSLIITIISVFIHICAEANNLTISNVSLQDRDPANNTVVVQFDLTMENSWRTKINHDAAWITVRLFDPTVTPSDKKLCELKASGLNPSGVSSGNGTAVDIAVPSDKKGAFIRLANFGEYEEVDVLNMKLTVDYGSCGFDAESNVAASVLGIEMVYVPEGAFYAGDNGSSTAAFIQGAADTDPWAITSESTINVSNPSSDGFRYVSAGYPTEDPTGSTFTIPASFPKGYAPFYVMKYEINEGQWVEFLNSLPSAAARANRDITDNLHKNSDAVKFRNTISCSGTPLVCNSSRPARAASFLSWMDVTAFLDWAALRPVSELEFEKMARGPVLPVRDELVWGSTLINAASVLSDGDEEGNEYVLNSGANASFENIVLSGGDAVNGADYAQGPLRNGIFATAESSRESSGASYYGVLELSGNVYERTVSVGNENGRSFAATNGDGLLTTAIGYEGNATNSDWPGIDGVLERGVTGAAGSGFRGGAWDDATMESLRTSDRYAAAFESTAALNNTGGRGARSFNIND
jgi:formylglycine-generating enzyme required for sulfatase activity